VYDYIYEKLRREFSDTEPTGDDEQKYLGYRYGNINNVWVHAERNYLFYGDTLLAGPIGQESTIFSISDPVCFDDIIYVGYSSSGTPTISKFDCSTGSETVVHTGTPATGDRDQVCNVFVSDTTAYFSIGERFTSGGDYWDYWSVQELDLANESATELFTSEEIATSDSVGIYTFGIGLTSSDVCISFSEYFSTDNCYKVKHHGTIDRSTGVFTETSGPAGMAAVFPGYKGHALAIDGIGFDQATDHMHIWENGYGKSWELSSDYFDHWPQVYIIDDSAYPYYTLICEKKGAHQIVALNSDETITVVKELFPSASTTGWAREGSKTYKLLPFETDYIRRLDWAQRGFILPKYEIL
jgi:hypothetical protein